MGRKESKRIPASFEPEITHRIRINQNIQLFASSSHLSL